MDILTELEKVGIFTQNNVNAQKKKKKKLNVLSLCDKNIAYTTI